VSITMEGTTNVTYSAVDIAGNNESSKSFPVKVDKTLPVISGMPVGCTLSPPKHQLVQVATITASDTVSGLAALTVTATSSESDSGTGGGDVPGDIVINGGMVQLRAERSPSGRGRTYTINATATDMAGNVAGSTATCQVPK
jgi:pantoate kinase